MSLSGQSDADGRASREQDFHDHAFENKTRARVGKFYSITRRSSDCYQSLLAAIRPGERVLEYGCGEGSSAFSLARRGVFVTGIDISPVGIEHARQTAATEQLTTAEFAVMDAEHLEFSNGHFDVVCGGGILHHLDLERSLPEIARVLKPQGSAYFSEPLGHNPLINLYRQRTPSLRTPDEHPLLISDLSRFSRYFADVKVHYFHLFSIAAVPFRSFGFFRGLLTALESFDRFVFATIPFMRRYAWMVVIELSAPVAKSGDGAAVS